MQTLKEIREARGETVTKFAEAIGASPSQVSEWEKGEDHKLTVEKAAQIEAKLGVTGLVAAAVAARVQAAA